ncbi:MAG: hypothetical protein D6675_00350 [Gemmatimonadetes bacterium]|nr:MAG: hypothetical protein D6675_00350 [Gemmatimonadota bacterium]
MNPIANFRLLIKPLPFLLVSFMLCYPLVGFAQGGAGASAANLNTPVSLDADEAYLPSVLAILAEQSGFNIVTGPGVDKAQKLSIRLQDVPIEQAINLVVRASGLSYEIVGNSFLIASTETLTKDDEVGLKPYLIELQHANVEEVKDLLADLTDNVQTLPMGNALLINTNPKTIEEIRHIIDQIDKPSFQIMLETRIIEVETNYAREMGIDWSKLTKLTTILVENGYSEAEGIYTLGQAGESRFEELGDFEILPDQQGYQPLDGLSNIGHFSRQLTAFDVTLDFMLKNNVAEIVADTRLTTMNNRQANLHIGETIPYTVSNVVVGGGTGFSIERENVGTKLEIKPIVNADGFITLEVTPEVSSVVELINGELPRTKVRKASTTVIVKDGERVVLGGFLGSEDVNTEYRLPFFSNLPLIGNWFRYNSMETKRTELLIEITPHILKNGKLVNGDVHEDFPMIDMRDEMREKATQQHMDYLQEKKNIMLEQDASTGE